MTDISRLRRLAGLLNESHDPATEQMLDQACDCALPDCERCNPQDAPVTESYLEESIEDAYARFMSESGEARHPNTIRREIESTRNALVSYLSGGPDDDTSRSMRERLRKAIEELKRANAQVSESFADAIASDMKDRGHGKPKRDGFAGAIANDMKNRKRRADAERPVSEGGFADAIAGDMKDRATGKPKRNGFANAIASDMKDRKRRADTARDTNESFDEPGQKYEPWKAKNAAGYPGGEDASTWEDCEDCGGSGLANGPGDFGPSGPCYTCDGEGGWTREEEEDPIDEAYGDNPFDEAQARKALEHINAAMACLGNADLHGIQRVLDDAHSRLCSALEHESDDVVEEAAEELPISAERARQAIEKARTNTGRLQSQPSDFMTHAEKDAVRAYFMKNGKGGDTFNSVLARIAKGRG